MGPNPPGRRVSKLLASTMFQLQPGRIHVLQSHSWQAPRKWWNKTLPYVKLCVSWKPGAFGAGLFLVSLFIYLNIYCESESQYSYILYIMDHYGQSKIVILTANLCLFVD